MSTETALTEAQSEEIAEFAAELEWVPLEGAGALPRWEVPGLEAEVAWYQVDDAVGAFIAEGPDAELLIQDIALGLDLLDDVDVMTRIGEAAAPDEVATWARRLGVFARGPTLQPVIDVLRGLVESTRGEFAAAAVEGLARAEWPELLPLLDDAQQRWPGLTEACHRARASIHRFGRPLRG